MKKISFGEGFPATPQAFNAMQTAFEDALKAIATAFGNCIVSGCVIGAADGGGAFPVSEGFILLDGLVLRVPPHNIAPGAGVRVFYKTTAHISDNPVTNYPSGEITEMVREEIALVKTVSAPGAGEVLYSVMPRVDDKLSKYFSGKWTIVTPETGADLDIGVLGNDSNFLSYEMVGKEIVIRGNIRITTSLANGSSRSVAILPEGFRPVLTSLFPFSYVLDHNGNEFWLQVTAAGAIRLTNRSGGSLTNAIIGIHDYRFRID